MDSEYITLPASGSLDVFPQNSLTNFRIQLAKPLILDGQWECGLSELYLDSSVNNIGTSDAKIHVIRSEIPDHLLTDQTIIRRDALLALGTPLSSQIDIPLVPGSHTLKDIIDHLNEELNKRKELNHLHFIIDEGMIGIYMYFTQPDYPINFDWKTIKIPHSLRKVLGLRQREVALDNIFKLKFVNKIVDIEVEDIVSFRGVDNVGSRVAEERTKDKADVGDLIEKDINISYTLVPGEMKTRDILRLLNDFIHSNKELKDLFFKYDTAVNTLSLFKRINSNPRIIWKKIQLTKFLENLISERKKDQIFDLDFFHNTYYPNIQSVLVPINETIKFIGTRYEDVEPTGNWDHFIIYLNEGRYSLKNFFEYINTRMADNYETAHLKFHFKNSRLSLVNKLKTNEDEILPITDWKFVNMSDEIKKLLMLDNNYVPIEKLTNLKVEPKEFIPNGSGEFFTISGHAPVNMVPISSDFITKPGKYLKSTYLTLWNDFLAEKETTNHLKWIVRGSSMKLHADSKKVRGPSWSTVRFDPTIKAIFGIEQEDILIKEISSIPFVEDEFIISSEITSQIKGRTHVDESVSKIIIDEDEVIFSEMVVDIEPKLYHTLDTLIEAINNAFSSRTLTSDLRFELSKDKTMLSLDQTVIRDWIKTDVKISPQLASILGLSEHYSDFINANILQNLKVNNEIQSTAPKLIFVYSDLIAESYVGDITARLLRTIRVNYSGISNDLEISQIYNRINYIPVDSTYVSTINIALKSAEAADFPLNPGQCVVVLHLRRKQ
ncbi:unnamed protein product [Rotaria magnacalcarata]|uniref:Uncharacterized protein n=1 Tax=Rotaria magnacalcarata TaxID=392030 RepID=A0A816Z087_9BILA|nr:unnamed protein product [Rotaria magnacalcarata]CAF4057572.1 unnamed protein product [Rotaria magnacalcarata]